MSQGPVPKSALGGTPRGDDALGAPPTTRQALLDELLGVKPDGLTLDELADRLNVARNTVRQQVTALERDGLVAQNGLRPSGRRPSRTYGLTEYGMEAFPRRYDLLSLTMLRAIRQRVGEEAAEDVLMKMAEGLAANWLPALERLEARERTTAVVEIMNQLGYKAAVAQDGESLAAINCVYHHVAQETRAVCRFDERLLSLLLGKSVHLTSCMAEGQGSCVFAKLTSGSKAQ